MNAIKVAGAIGIVIMVFLTPSTAGSQSFDDSGAVLQFQRSADAYAFQHRQVQRRLGEGADPSAMVAGLRTARPAAADGDIFTPAVAAAFRARISTGLRAAACRITAPDSASYEVPRVGAVASGTQSLPGCLSAVLPRLPEELEYRVAGVAVVLLDTHANMVVDVLHGAFPRPDER